MISAHGAEEWLGSRKLSGKRIGSEFDFAAEYEVHAAVSDGIGDLAHRAVIGHFDSFNRLLALCNNRNYLHELLLQMIDYRSQKVIDAIFAGANQKIKEVYPDPFAICCRLGSLEHLWYVLDNFASRAQGLYIPELFGGRLGCMERRHILERLLAIPSGIWDENYIESTLLPHLKKKQYNVKEKSYLLGYLLSQNLVTTSIIDKFIELGADIRYRNGEHMSKFAPLSSAIAFSTNQDILKHIIRLAGIVSDRERRVLIGIALQQGNVLSFTMLASWSLPNILPSNAVYHAICTPRGPGKHPSRLALFRQLLATYHVSGLDSESKSQEKPLGKVEGRELRDYCLALIQHNPQYFLEIMGTDALDSKKGYCGMDLQALDEVIAALKSAKTDDSYPFEPIIEDVCALIRKSENEITSVLLALKYGSDIEDVGLGEEVLSQAHDVLNNITNIEDTPLVDIANNDPNVFTVGIKYQECKEQLRAALKAGMSDFGLVRYTELFDLAGYKVSYKLGFNLFFTHQEIEDILYQAVIEGTVVEQNLADLCNKLVKEGYNFRWILSFQDGRLFNSALDKEYSLLFNLLISISEQEEVN